MPLCCTSGLPQLSSWPEGWTQELEVPTAAGKHRAPPGRERGLSPPQSRPPPYLLTLSWPPNLHSLLKLWLRRCDQALQVLLYRSV